MQLSLPSLPRRPPSLFLLRPLHRPKLTVFRATTPTALRKLSGCVYILFICSHYSTLNPRIVQSFRSSSTGAPTCGGPRQEQWLRFSGIPEDVYSFPGASFRLSTGEMTPGPENNITSKPQHMSPCGLRRANEEESTADRSPKALCNERC